MDNGGAVQHHHRRHSGHLLGDGDSCHQGPVIFFFILGSSFVFFLRSTLGIIVVAAYDDACEDKPESQVNTYVEYE